MYCFRKSSTYSMYIIFVDTDGEIEDVILDDMHCSDYITDQRSYFEHKKGEV